MWQHDWMSKWALYSPNKVAVSQLEDGASLTYVELNRLAEKVAFFSVFKHDFLYPFIINKDLSMFFKFSNEVFHRVLMKHFIFS